jgi:hypothetical protein
MCKLHCDCEGSESEGIKKESKTKNMEIAKTILEQLGGRYFTMMTGSKNFVADKNSLRMNLTRNKAKAKWLKVTLNGKDLYDMDFFTADKEFNIKTKVRYEDVYFDQLQARFTEATGLYTRL